MATSHKFSTVAKAQEAFPGIPIRHNRTRETFAVFNSKDNAWEPVKKGQFIVSIADRYEVHDEDPENAKPAEPEADKPKRKSEPKKEENAPSMEPDNTVSPEHLAAPHGTDDKSDK